MARYITVKLTTTEAAAVLLALDCEIPTRKQGSYDDLGRRIDPKGEALDDEVPAMERARRKIREAKDD